MGTPSNRMTALVKTEPAPGMVLEERPVPEPGPEEVRLRVRSVGVDGGAEALIYDWHPSKHRYEPHLPQIFGHEFAGEVDEPGADADGWEAGDRVAVEPAIVCGDCRHCRAGDRNLCSSDDRRGIGLDTDVDGALAEYVTVPVSTLYRLPDSLSYDEGTFLELLALGVNGVEQSSFEPGDRVAITGPGSAGLSALIAAVAGGASEAVVIGAEGDAGSRLPTAERMGATATATIDEVASGEFAFDEPVDVFFEASGHVDALDAAVRNTRKGGEIVQIGVYHDAEADGAVPVDVNHLVRNGISLLPIYARRDSSWRRAIAMAEGMDLSPVVGPSFPMDDYEAAFAAVRERAGVKVTLHP